MILSLRPDRLYRHFSEVTPDIAKKDHVKLILCDLDYTLAIRSRRHPDEVVRNWIAQMQEAGIALMIISNNRNSTRVREFCEGLGISYEGHAQKPLPRGCRRAMAKVGAGPEETALLGDKLLTDMLCANLTGCRAWMVEPLDGGSKDPWNRFLRQLQRPWKAMRREKA